MNVRTLSIYTMFETLLQPMFKAYFGITGLLFIFLALTPRLPQFKTVTEIAYLFFLLYFVVGTASIIIDRVERGSIELFLSKPFSRTDIIVATLLGVIGLVSLFSIFLVLGLWFIWGLRVGVWSGSILSYIGSLIFGFGTLYCFVLLSGIIIRNLAAIVFIWCGYVLFGSLALELRSTMLYPNIESDMIKGALDVLYYLLPQPFAIRTSFNSLFRGGSPSFLPVVTSCLTASLALLAAIFVLERKDL
ncbi:MAG: hypothetical protein V3V40_04010 [Nitrosomonadaceae bacterium]